ncbi:GNAT family N-acetyltransferase [Jeotgalicoccus meleagridis]|uniref:Protein ElaA n=1 Tax=Jeotgalicoccus meleagridis TaxID=2759181 RepID=A0A6V7RLF6_9STAP|nr:GNAT family N-acetyltransferase [Jeotgalicoccus meleagridis]CAD2078916.1 Protein ElaA [Jeotgalicoccus meleagridis]
MWHLKSFDELSNSELEQIFRLREAIFIVEQKSYFNDIDGKDYNALHLFNKDESNNIWAYSRILNYTDYVSFGRVTVQQTKRGNGNGRKLLDKVFDVINEKYPDKDIRILAMSYLRSFYESYGFKAVSEEYIVDQHPHIDMIYFR